MARGKHAKQAASRRDRESLALAAESAERRAARLESESAEATARLRHQVETLTTELSTTRKLMAEGSSPEVERLRRSGEDQRQALDQARRRLSAWGKYRKRFDSRLARTLARNFNLHEREARALVTEVWMLTAGRDADRLRELGEWLGDEQERGSVNVAVTRGRITAQQADAITQARHGRFKGRPEGDTDPVWGRLWTSDEDIWDDERDALDIDVSTAEGSAEGGTSKGSEAVAKPYGCPGCGARYRTAEHAAGCADDHVPTEGGAHP